MCRFFERIRHELNIVEYVEHEMINRHRAPRCPPCLCLFRFLLTTCAVKKRRSNSPGVQFFSIEQGNSVGVILNDPSTGITLYFWVRLAFVIYLEYKCHKTRLSVDRSVCNWDAKSSRLTSLMLDQIWIRTSWPPPQGYRAPSGQALVPFHIRAATKACA